MSDGVVHLAVGPLNSCIIMLNLTVLRVSLNVDGCMKLIQIKIASCGLAGDANGD